MNQIIANLAALGRKRLILMGATGLGIILALLFGLSAVLTPNWRPIATDLTASEGAAMVRALEQAGYAPRVSNDGTLVSLPEDQISRARMALAEAGVAAEGMPGWELFDDQNSLGMNTFLQRVNRLRALEGELARSIQTLDAVETARVHLVLPEREAFSAERPEPSAAVIIRTRRGMSFERAQALAVRSLVAASLPSLIPENVTVLSASGETILSSDGPNGDGSGATHTARIAIEERLARNIEQILGARVGAGNVRVRVAAELATAREVIQRESFDPDSSAPREIRSSSENSQSNSGPSGNGVDVLTNIPGGLQGQGGGDSRNDSRNRSEDQTRFEIGSTRSETVIEPGGLRRLSVAVLVNGHFVEGEYADRDAPELERLTALVRSTMGYDEARGDVLTVDSLRFVDDGGLLIPGHENSMAEDMLGHLPSLVRWAIALLIVLIVVFFAIRPAINRLARPETAAAGSAAGEDGAEDGEGAEGGAKGGRKSRKRKSATDANGQPIDAEDDIDEDGDDEEPEEQVELVSVQGTITRRQLDDLGELIEKDRDASLRQIRQWLSQKP